MTRQAARVALVLLALVATFAHAEDGYDLWLRYRPLDDAAQAAYAPFARGVVAARADVGVLYGTFALLRLVQTQQPIDKLDVRSAPRVQLRVLDHWDNL